MIVVDASAAVAALLNAGPARRALASDQLHAPHLVDSEVASVLRRQVSIAQLAPDDAWKALDTWRHLGLTRYAVIGMIDRVWQLRDNLTAYDATYVALAEQLGCGLLTCDGRLGRAARVRCPITVVSG
ncbi:MAG: type II toxin-antitoxin system VapC family toxin [Candidatus Dormibacteraceae bacterium]